METGCQHAPFVGTDLVKGVEHRGDTVWPRRTEYQGFLPLGLAEGDEGPVAKVRLDIARDLGLMESYGFNTAIAAE